MKKLAIMQPYLFPYIGYFQLVNSVDKFISYNDVHFIKQGWINRNNILSGGKARMFTVPLRDASSFRLIRDTLIDDRTYSKWKKQFYKTIEVNYMKAPFYEQTAIILRKIFDLETLSISALSESSLRLTCDYLGINTLFSDSSVYNNSKLNGIDRLIDICKIEDANVYINPIGGRELYTKQEFKKSGIDLFFISTGNISYRQNNSDFIPWLSIIDVMMFNSAEQIKIFLSNFELV